MTINECNKSIHFYRKIISDYSFFRYNFKQACTHLRRTVCCYWQVSFLFFHHSCFSYNCQSSLHAIYNITLHTAQPVIKHHYILIYHHLWTAWYTEMRDYQSLLAFAIKSNLNRLCFSEWCANPYELTRLTFVEPKPIFLAFMSSIISIIRWSGKRDFNSERSLTGMLFFPVRVNMQWWLLLEGLE